MNLYLQSLYFTLEIVAPIFFIVLLGLILRRTRLIDEHFTSVASRLVFMVTLPVLIFTAIATTDFHAVYSFKQLLFVVLVTLFVFIFLFWAASRWVTKPADQGVFVQGAFRSNYGIIGLAVSFNLFGNEGLAQASLLLAIIIPLFNLLSILALTLPFKSENHLSIGSTLIEIAKNPLIIAVVLALPISYFNYPLPVMLTKTGGYLANITLPLALLTIGSALNLKSLRSSSSLAIWATLAKLFIIPVFATVLAWLAGFSNHNIAMLMVLFACPTAAVSFVMAKAMQGNATLAANIILTTTLGSVVTLSLGIYLLKIYNLI